MKGKDKINFKDMKNICCTEPFSDSLFCCSFSGGNDLIIDKTNFIVIIIGVIIRIGSSALPDKIR